MKSEDGASRDDVLRQEVLAVAAGGSRLELPAQAVVVGLAMVLKAFPNQRELARRAGLPYKAVHKFLNGHAVRNAPTERLLETLECSPAEVRMLRSFVEDWTGLDTGYFSAGELEWVEARVAAAARELRRDFKLALKGGPNPEILPPQRDWVFERMAAEELRQGLEEGYDEEERADIVRMVERYQSWSFAVVCAEWSEKQASKSAASALHWARLGYEAAERAPNDPSGLTSVKVQGYCGAHVGNALRVFGELDLARESMTLAIAQWEEGEDPMGLLDPGRVYELAASLWSDLREPEEALRLLDTAEPITRRRAHVELKRGTSLAEMGRYAEAEAVLAEAGGLIEASGTPRLRNVQKYNLCSVLVHLGRYEEAAGLLEEVRELASQLGDKLDLVRIRWIEGRIARGRGEGERAIEALERAAAAFKKRFMDYDAGLARFEVATLHLEMGEPDRSAQIAGELVELFASYKDYEEVRKALELYVEAVRAKRVTTELACSILGYLYLAQNQKALAFRESYEPS